MTLSKVGGPVDQGPVTGIMEDGRCSRERPSRCPEPQAYVGLCLVLAAMSWASALAYHNMADGDLWAKLMLGAWLSETGKVLQQDLFAFTPVLNVYVDHEWGAGAVFYAVLKSFGPGGLMALKIVLAFGALIAGILIARRNNCSWSTVLLILPFSAAALINGYVPVIRSHAFTFLLFGIVLLALEELRRGKRIWGIMLVPIILVWTNLHGGFVAGLGTIGVYTVCAILERKERLTFTLVCVVCLAATLANPFGLDFWRYLIPALLHPRPEIMEWQPLPLWSSDAFVGFRIVFLLVVVVVAVGWRSAQRPSWPGLLTLVVTGYLGWRSRRHGPFFAVAAMAFATPFLEAVLAQVRTRLRTRWPRWELQPLAVAAVFHIGIAAWALFVLLPGSSFQVLAPVGQFPVREADILKQSGLKGNLVVPFAWGSYCSWRLYPNLKVSIDGRYEAAYLETTFTINMDFMHHRGADWDRILTQYPIDFIMLDYKQGRLRPKDLAEKGYQPVWESTTSALLARAEHLQLLRETVRNLPATTIDPLDASIPLSWCRLSSSARQP